MVKSERNPITSCTISWENTQELLSAVTKVLQTEIHVRLYNRDQLIGGRIWPMSDQQKQELYSIFNRCVEEWDCDDYTVHESDRNHWQIKICAQRRCLRTVCGTTEPPPHGGEMKKMLAGIIGEENCYLF